MRRYALVLHWYACKVVFFDNFPMFADSFSVLSIYRVDRGLGVIQQFHFHRVNGLCHPARSVQDTRLSDCNTDPKTNNKSFHDEKLYVIFCCMTFVKLLSNEGSQTVWSCYTLCVFCRLSTSFICWCLRLCQPSLDFLNRRISGPDDCPIHSLNASASSTCWSLDQCCNQKARCPAQSALDGKGHLFYVNGIAVWRQCNCNELDWSSAAKHPALQQIHHQQHLPPVMVLD